MSATVNMSLDEYEVLKARAAKAESETLAVQVELAAAKMADPTSTVTKVTAFAREALNIARFAIANCPPEVIKNWPYESLRRVCDTINCLPDFDENDRSMALDLREFIGQCEQHAQRRRNATVVHDNLAALAGLAGSVEIKQPKDDGDHP